MKFCNSTKLITEVKTDTIISINKKTEKEIRPYLRRYTI